jgi:hypothetical protein
MSCDFLERDAAPHGLGERSARADHCRVDAQLRAARAVLGAELQVHRQPVATCTRPAARSVVGRWSRRIGGEGGRVIPWRGRLIVVSACTTAWDSAHEVISKMGDRFLLIRLRTEDRRSAGLKAISNVNVETAMREELGELVAKLLGIIPATGQIKLTGTEAEQVLDLADLVSQARSPVERDYKGEPLFAHAPEVPTRLSKELAQLARGGIALGMRRPAAMRVVERVAADTMPPLRFRVLTDVASNPDSTTADVVKRLQVPRKTIDRTLQELHLLELLTTMRSGSVRPPGGPTHWPEMSAGMH